MGQALHARRMGKKRVIAETGAGQHGVATAMVGAVPGLPVVGYMGALHIPPQSLDVVWARPLGGPGDPLKQGSQPPKAAINQRPRGWGGHGRTSFKTPTAKCLTRTASPQASTIPASARSYLR